MRGSSKKAEPKPVTGNVLTVDRLKKLRLDENAKYRIKIGILESAIDKVVTMKKVRAKLIQQTDYFFAFQITTKSGDKRIETVNKFDYIKNPTLIEVIL